MGVVKREGRGSGAESADIEEQRISPPPRTTAGSLTKVPIERSGSVDLQIDLIEDPVVFEELLRGRTPAAEDLVDREEL